MSKQHLLARDVYSYHSFENDGKPLTRRANFLLRGLCLVASHTLPLRPSTLITGRAISPVHSTEYLWPFAPTLNCKSMAALVKLISLPSPYTVCSPEVNSIGVSTSRTGNFFVHEILLRSILHPQHPSMTFLLFRNCIYSRIR